MVTFGVFGVIMMVIGCTCVSGMKFKCHRDICDATWQFCNDGEERCNTCTPEQCEADVAEHIFNQCETLCKTLQKTSTEKASTTESNTNDVPSQVQSKEFFMPIILIGVILIIVLLILLLLVSGISIRYLRQIRKQQIDAEKGSQTVSYETLQIRSEPEKVPLLEDGVQVSDSGLHVNKMADIQILADATSNVNQMDIKQPSAPPSYSTEDNRDRFMSPVACEDDLPTGGNFQVTEEQDHKCENLGDTNLLPTHSLSTDDSTCITHPKSVTC